MKTLLYISLISLLGLLTSNLDAQAQNASLILVGSPAVQLNALVSGFDSAVATDENDSTLLVWSKTKNKSKVTVSTFSPGQKFDLFVEATKTRSGKSTGRIKLVDGMMDTDLVVNIKKKKAGYAHIRYVTQVRIEQGNTESDFADVHTVTFTITTQ